MGSFSYGSITVGYPDNIEIPAEAGNLTADQVRRLPKGRKGIGLVCDQTASAMERATGLVTGDVTPDALRTKGRMAEDIDQVIDALEVVTVRMKQANLLLDADAWEALRRVYDLLKAQAKFRPELSTQFAFLTDFMTTNPGSRGNGAAVPPAPSTSSGTPSDSDPSV